MARIKEDLGMPVGGSKLQGYVSDALRMEGQAMSDAEWVRDPALIELMARMEVFREGDEIIVQRAVDYSIPYECDGKAFTLIRPDNIVFEHKAYRSWTLEEVKEKEVKRRALREKEEPIPPELEDCNAVPVGKFKDGEGYEWYVVWQNIAAWRRP